jgi:hypothetical protein
MAGEFDYAPSDYLIDLPVMIPKDGVAPYPEFAADDFDAAYDRLLNLVGQHMPSTEIEQDMLVRDRMVFPHLSCRPAPNGHAMLAQDWALDFIAVVTGHPKEWVASWSYRVKLADLVGAHGQDWDALTMEFSKAHDAAIRYGAR